MKAVQWLNRLALSTLAPFAGLFIWVALAGDLTIELSTTESQMQIIEAKQGKLDALDGELLVEATQGENQLFEETLVKTPTSQSAQGTAPAAGAGDAVADDTDAGGAGAEGAATGGAVAERAATGGAVAEGAATGGAVAGGADAATGSSTGTAPTGDVSEVLEKLELARALAVSTSDTIQETASLYDETARNMQQLVQTASAQVNRPAQIYDRRITKKLGTPSDTVQSDKLRAQLFYVSAQNFRGYALKVKLKSEDAMRLVLGNDSFGEAETTLSAVRRYDALAGVTAGGYADQNGKRYPLSTTIVDGEYVNGFEPSFSDLFFVGLNKEGRLVGGKYRERAQLDKEEMRFGASFVPILLRNGALQPIPEKWRTSPQRAARTVVARYKDEQLLFLVTEAADESGRSGASLAELQLLLKRFGVVDAYNLDGGGSSSLVFKGRVVNKPSDGQLRKLATHFLLFE